METITVLKTYFWLLILSLLTVNIYVDFLPIDANAQWEITSGPYGATVKSISVSSSRIVAATYDNGVFLSTNSGLNWSNITGTLPNLKINTVLDIGSYIFVGTDGNGVYRSSNSGVNWLGPGTNITNRTINSLVFSAEGILYAGTDTGVFRSTNSGVVWLRDTAGCGPKYIYTLAILDTNIFAGTNSYGIYRKNVSAGTSWSQVNNGLPANITIYSLSINDTNITTNRILYAGTAGKGVYRTTNRGGNWIQLGNLPSYYVYGLYTPSGVYMGESSRGVFLTTNNGTNWTAINSGLGVTVVYTLAGSSSSNLFVGMQGGGGIYKSTNSGQNWTASFNGINAAIVLSLLKTGTYLFAAAQSSGVYVSTNYGINWIARINGLADIRTQALGLAPTDIGPNPVVLLGTTTGAYYSTSYGVNWIIDTTGMGNRSVLSFYAYDSLVLAGTSNGVYKRQTDAGVWTAINNGLITSVFAVYGNGSTLYAGTSSGVFRSTNFGTNWSTFSTGMPTFRWVYTFLYNGSNLFAGTISGLYHLSGTTWVLDSAGMGGNQVVYSLAYSGNNIFAGTHNGVFYSGNGGVSWTAKNDGFTVSPPPIRALTLDTSNYLYAGTSGRSVWRRNYQNALPVNLISFTHSLKENNVTLSWITSFEINNFGFEIQRKSFLSPGGSDSWNTIGFIKGAGNTTGESQYTFVDKNLTSGSYQYRLKQIDFNGAAEFHNLQTIVVIGAPNKDFLEQSFPNPSNPRSKILFGISQPGNIRLVIYDVLGREVKTLLKGYYNAGYYLVEFDGSGLSSGIYFYSLSSVANVQIKKMILLK
ncbi:MAG: T9SS type A sorting domain-containing protein [Ignavibacteria bacterium]